MAVLVTGGGGYIGSHTARFLGTKREDVVVVDNFQTGHEKSLEGLPYYRVDVRDGEGLNRVFQTHSIEAVIHFAASSLVGESMENPFGAGVWGD